MRRAHVYTSRLGTAISRYVALRRALGCAFDGPADIFAHLDRFLVARGPDADLTAESFAAWCLTFTHLMPGTRRRWMELLRNLCLHRRRTEPGCFVPDNDLFPAAHQPKRPHIFTEAEIVQILRTAYTLRHPRSKRLLGAEGLRLAIVLLYTAGLRRGELVRLVISDFDPTDRTLLIRESKFHKSRLIALSGDATREVDAYLEERRRLPHGPDAPLLVVRHRGIRARSGAGLGISLQRLFERAGVRTSTGRVPRVHDLRHTYAVHALLRWYRAGADVQARLPALATAMGHVNVASTAHYLTLIEPLVEAASERFARYFRERISPAPVEGGRP